MTVSIPLQTLGRGALSSPHQSNERFHLWKDSILKQTPEKNREVLVRY